MIKGKRPEYGAFKGRPGEGTRFLVRKNSEAMIDLILNDAAMWNLNVEQNYSVLLQLENFILCCEDGVTEYAPKILRVLYKHISEDDKVIQSVCLKCAYALGFFVSPDVLVPQFLSDVQNKGEDSLTFKQSFLNILNVMIEEINGFHKEDLKPHLKVLVEFLRNPEFEALESLSVRICFLNITSSLMNISREDCEDYQHELFQIILNLSSILDNKPVQENAKHLMVNLSTHCGMKSVVDLFSVELSAALTEFKAEFKDWNKASPKRYAFDLLVRSSKQALSEYWTPILEIISKSIDFSKDFELRFDMLALAEELIESEEVQSSLALHSKILFTTVLIPCAVWRAGKPVAKIRKASVTCMIKALERKLIKAEEVYSIFKDIIPILKSCLDDDWAPDLRFAACVYFRKLMAYLEEFLNESDFKEIHPLLLSRLDDSQDSIRIEVCNALVVFFNLLPLSWDPTSYDNILRTIFIHFDDPSRSIADAVEKVLYAAAPKGKSSFLAIAKSLSNFQHPESLNALIDDVESIQKVGYLTQQNSPLI